MEPEMTPLPPYGDHMLVSDFTEFCARGYFIDYDGYGMYATKDKMTKLIVHPSDIANNEINTDYHYVVWFNR